MIHYSEARLDLSRNVALGAGGVQLACLLTILAIDAKGPFLGLAVYACAVGLPLWSALAGTYELIIMDGKHSYAFLNTLGAQLVQALAMLVGGVTLVATLALILAHMYPGSAGAFGVSGIVSFVVLGGFAGLHKHWQQRRDAAKKADTPPKD